MAGKAARATVASRPRPAAAGARVCGLEQAAGRVETCSEASCSFWEQGGAVVAGGCLLDRLALDLEQRPELAYALLHVRRRLDQALSREDEAEARALLFRLVAGAGSSEEE